MAVYQLKDSSPTIAASAYVAPSASVIGHVVLAEQSSVWFGATLRGDNEINLSRLVAMLKGMSQ